jgi:hypothetical protein
VKPRLLIDHATNDLETLARVAEAVSVLADRYDLRMVVSHLAIRNDRRRTDPGDPYLQYSSNFPDLFSFVVPEAIKSLIDDSSIEANVRLAENKLAVLVQHGILGAFVGREPVHEPEALFRRYPHWRGPRIDHPRRSRNPLFAPCLHQAEVQDLYREAARGLAERLPGIDTFYWWTNDSAAGFCWYPYLYPGANGPAACRDLGPVPAMAAFHSAILEGSRAGGVRDPMSIMTHTRVWDDTRMPAGSHTYPASATAPQVMSVAADLSLTYPVRYLWDPLARLEQLDMIRSSDPVAIVWWLSDIYHRASSDIPSTQRQVALWDLATRDGTGLDRLPGRLALLLGFAAAQFGQEAADDVVDGWISLREAFVSQRHNPFPHETTYLPTYGAVSMRWLIRPLVPFPDELSPQETADFLPHVFAIGDEARRDDLLDLHGYPAASASEPHDIYRQYYGQITSALERASACFERASLSAQGTANTELAITARAAALLARIWRSCGNWIEFALLRGQSLERSKEDRVPLTPAERDQVDAYREQLHGIVRDELDNMLAFEALWGSDAESVVARGNGTEDEDSFTLAPDLAAQLTRRRETMLAHWQDAARLVPLASWRPRP